MAHFFISYASEDIAKAREICALLTSLGATYWIAPDHIDPGEAYTLAIPKAIRECAYSCFSSPNLPINRKTS